MSNRDDLRNIEDVLDGADEPVAERFLSEQTIRVWLDDAQCMPDPSWREDRIRALCVTALFATARAEEAEKREDAARSSAAQAREAAIEECATYVEMFVHGRIPGWVSALIAEKLRALSPQPREEEGAE